MAGAFDDLIPAAAQQAPAAVGAPAFPDTGQPGTPGQQTYYGQGFTSGAFDPKAPVGSAKNPYALRHGDPQPKGYFVDLDGKLQAPGTPIPSWAAAQAGAFDDLLPAKEPLVVDVAKSGETGLRKGVAQLAGTGGDLVNFLAPNGGGFHMALGAAQDLTGSDLGQPYWGGDKNLGLQTGLDWGHGYGPAQAADSTNWAHRLGLFTSDDGNHAFQQIAPYHVPQTTAGRYVQSVAEYAPAAVLGGETNVQRALGAFAPGVASQAGEDMFHSPYGRLAGGVLGLGVAHVGAGVARSPDQLFADSFANTTAEQRQAAVELMRQGEARGVQVPFTEAIQHVTGGATGAGRLQRVIESTKDGQMQLAPMFAQRPDQIRGAVMAHADTLAPPITAPSLLAANAKDAATDVLRGAETARTQAVDPFYRAADPQTVPPDDVAGIIGDLHDQAAADKTGLLAGPLKNLADLLTDKPATQKALDDYNAAMASRAQMPPPADPNADGLAQALTDVRQYGPKQTGSLFSAIRNKGGLKLRDGFAQVPGPDVAPYLDGVRMPGLVNNASGMPGERLAQSLADEGWFGPNPGDPSAAFAQAVEREARGNPVFHPDAYAPDHAANAEQLQQELMQAGVKATDPPQVQAQKLWELRNGDQAEAAAIRDEANRNDPDGLEFDRLSAPPQPPGVVPITDIANLDRVRKAVRDKIELGFAPVGREPLVKEQAAALGDALQNLDGLMERASPEFQQGKQTFAQFTNNVNRPLEVGPLGRISNGQGARTALFPAQAPEGTPAETAMAMRLLDDQREGLAGSLTRQHVVDSFNEASQSNLDGPNAWGGAKWAAGVMGNPEQRATLAAAYGELPGGADKLDDLNHLADVLQATGQRLRVGSNTTEKLTDLQGLKLSKAGNFLRDFNIAEPFSMFGHAADAMAYRMRLRSMVDKLMASPDEMHAQLGSIDLNRNLNRGALSQLLLQAPAAYADR